MKVLSLFLFLLISLPWTTYAVKINPIYLEQIKKDGWESIGEKKDLYIYRKETKKGPMAFRSVGLIHAPIMKILTIIRDVENAPKWTPGLIEKKIVTEYSYIDAVTYNLNQIPWPAQNRDTLIRSILSVDTDKRWLVVKSFSVEDPKYPPKKGVVRATIYSSQFIFKKISDDTTFVDVDAHVDPKGLIPTWLANYVQKEWPSSFMKALEDNALKSTLPSQDIFQKMLDQIDLLDKTGPTLSLSPVTP